MTSASDAPYSLVGDASGFAPLDRADHLRGDGKALASLWPEARVLRLDSEGRAAADASGYPVVVRGDALAASSDDAYFLGLDATGQAWFALPRADLGDAHIDLRTAAASWSPLEANAYATAHALHHWHLRHRYCGFCGGDIEFVRAGWLGRCLRCTREHYPRTDPAVIVAVGEGSRLLLGRQAAWPARRHSVIAGFVEPGETLEQAVAREVMEETGVRVVASRYLGSQPWPFPTSLMLGFIAVAEPGDVRDSEELEHARWFEREEIVEALAAEERGDTADAPLLMPSRISIAHWLVREWLDATAALSPAPAR
ncbi:NAD(+) diphosphatase [Lysobacter sp. TY2-98]|uniref:NAD(+) diphosphatase n=1 Tax=Lysobacter sp. TY2-98 TaxID=2290922 RepID=UPI000E2097A7|nr:NAD(+) diphosphatase [Lysobacter sp. TY2-98]AXK72692.1 NAD(+) diphosphatase [Lysobacter sp. TY2-98]